MHVVTSRLRAGQEDWDDASPFWDMPDTNDHAPTFFVGNDGTIYHFNGNIGGVWSDEYQRFTGILLRSSKDNGATWSAPRLICPEIYPISSVIQLRDGSILAPFDDIPWFSKTYLNYDCGETWDITHSEPYTSDCVVPGGTGPFPAGIHAAMAELRDGRILAFGRFDVIEGQERFNGTMPMSISSDGGKTWSYQISPFPSISSCQRPTILRLSEGPLVFFSFTDVLEVFNEDYTATTPLSADDKEGMQFKDSAGNEFTGFGLYGAVSFDNGETWPVRKLITSGCGSRMEGTTDNKPFEMSSTNAEPEGYMKACRTKDGMIHLISSRLHYRMNLEWLKEPPQPVA